jgi:hypothetical protein
MGFVDINRLAVDALKRRAKRLEEDIRVSIVIDA